MSVDPEILLEAHKEALRRLYKQSLFAFAKHCLGYKDMTKHTHGHMVACLEADTPRKLIVMPRGTFKSSIGVVGYALWRLIKNPNERILIDSEVYMNSKNFLREIKGHLMKPSFIDLFGDLRHGQSWREGEISLSSRTIAYKEASITCSGIETVKVGQHYSIIIGDDLNSGNNSATVEGRRKVQDHYKMNQAILEPDGTYVIIGTRYAVDDVIGTILSNELQINKTDEIYHPDFEAY